jgi:hypothetical protein
MLQHNSFLSIEQISGTNTFISLSLVDYHFVFCMQKSSVVIYVVDETNKILTKYKTSGMRLPTDCN